MVHLRVVGCKAFCPFDAVERKGEFGAKAWVGVMVGYSIDTSGYRVWDSATHKVWDVRGPTFDETATAGWWKQQAAAKRPLWADEAPLQLVIGTDAPAVEQPGAMVPVPPVDGDEGGGGPDGGGGGPAGGGGGGHLDDVDEDEEPLQLEGAPMVQPGPRMSQHERRGVPPQRLIEIMLASESDDGGAPASYEEALQGDEAEGWRKAFDAEVQSLNDNKVYTVVDRPPEKKVVRPIDMLTDIQSAKSLAENPFYPGRSKLLSKWHIIRKRVDGGFLM